jgi:hypothetical protein
MYIVILWLSPPAKSGMFGRTSSQPESLMIVIAVWAARLLLIIVILRIVSSMLFKNANPFAKKPEEKIKRFKAKHGTVEDADYKEL